MSGGDWEGLICSGTDAKRTLPPNGVRGNHYSHAKRHNRQGEKEPGKGEGEELGQIGLCVIPQKTASRDCTRGRRGEEGREYHHTLTFH